MQPSRAVVWKLLVFYASVYSLMLSTIYYLATRHPRRKFTAMLHPVFRSALDDEDEGLVGHADGVVVSDTEHRYADDVYDADDVCDWVRLVSAPTEDFAMSADFRSLQRQFDDIVTAAMEAESSSFSSSMSRTAGVRTSTTMTRVLHYIASRPSVHTVCETGFNAGHSAFNYLTASRRLVVHSFDIGQYAYTARIAANLSSDRHMFPARLFLHVGDSTKTVPQFIKENPRVRCSLIVVDGRHATLPVALSDAIHLAKIADNETLVVFIGFPLVENDEDEAATRSAAWLKEFDAKVTLKRVVSCYSLPDRDSRVPFAAGWISGSGVEAFRRRTPSTSRADRAQ